MKNVKSPGMDRFTVEFFKFFWIDIGHFILKSVNYAYENGYISVTQNQGIITSTLNPISHVNITFLKKKKKRPISLLNVIYI